MFSCCRVPWFALPYLSSRSQPRQRIDTIFRLNWNGFCFGIGVSMRTKLTRHVHVSFNVTKCTRIWWCYTVGSTMLMFARNVKVLWTWTMEWTTLHFTAFLSGLLGHGFNYVKPYSFRIKAWNQRQVKSSVFSK